MEPRHPTVTLITGTNYPVETIYSLWTASRTTGAYLQPPDVHERALQDPSFAEEVRKVFDDVVALGIPVGENISFTFMLDGVSISWREQAVRHRLGTYFGDNYAVDSIPDRSATSFWSQTMRTRDMADFATEEAFRLPPSIAADPKLKERFIATMRYIQDSYHMFREAGCTPEDSREVIPLGAHHRISMTVNFATLRNMCGKRGCWITQGNIWIPVIHQMVNLLAEEIDPVFRSLASPPCFKGKKRSGCIMAHENERREDGLDPLPICPLWANYNRHMKREELSEGTQERMPLYERFWGRDGFTGEQK